MKSNKTGKIIKAAIIGIIVAFLIAFLLLIISYFAFKEKIELATNIFSLVTFKDSSLEVEEETKIKVEEVEGKKLITKYPYIGDKYATLKVESCNIELPVYFGSGNDLLQLGICHYNGSYFPGEGGSIIYSGHNTQRFLYNIKDIQIGDRIVIEANYGTFTYEVYDIKIIQETDLNALPIQREEELFMLYTCYPFGYMGYTTQRMLMYSKLVSYDYGG